MRRIMNMPGRIIDSNIEIGKSTMNYVSFGKGSKPLVIIPGLSDGLRTVKGSGLMLWFFYKAYARDFRIWVFSRKNNLEPEYTTRDMAGDQAEAMDKLGLDTAYIMGVSQGGMISQWLAIDHPEKVKKLAIVISLARQNEVIQKVVTNWIDLAEKEKFGELSIDTMEKSFTEKYLKKYRLFLSLIKAIDKPQSKERFLIQANSCLTHNAYEQLSEIKCPTFIIGGGSDQVVGGPEVQEEMAAAIEDSRLKIYPHLGHGAYAEAPDFNEQILNFYKTI
ncbi:MAG: alpha/beta hydrolase [Bacillota bacterium]|nr:alpha/beta hydrolase [Bacillota bacterium]